ncbi:MAG: hypothetical protein LRY68_10835 [Sulfurospirillum sp.]|nr:hypothetical protein [Sulfurospirillum sp.]
MKLINHTYQTLEALETFIKDSFVGDEYLLIQLFYGDIPPENLSSLLTFFKVNIAK